MNDVQDFITANTPVSIIPPLPDLNEGYKLACAGLATLGKGGVAGFQAIQSGLQTSAKDEAQAFDAIFKAAELMIIAQVTAPASHQDSLQIVETFHEQKALLLTQLAQQWEDYADSFASTAKGKWASRARQRIKQQAQQLRDI